MLPATKLLSNLRTSSDTVMPCRPALILSLSLSFAGSKIISSVSFINGRFSRPSLSSSFLFFRFGKLAPFWCGMVFDRISPRNPQSPSRRRPGRVHARQSPWNISIQPGKSAGPQLFRPRGILGRWLFSF